MYNHVQEPVKRKMQDWIIRPKAKNSSCEKPSKTNLKKFKESKTPSVSVSWTVGDIAKAGRLLSSPPLPTNFEDEHEMRRVYTLIYDVFRYKSVLTQALTDIAFFARCPKLAKAAPHVWLLFYDLYHRDFKERETTVASMVQSLFESAGLLEVEQELWKHRIKLAAAVSRLRIQNNALSLSDLLPVHLRDERAISQAGNGPVTCWVNTKKVKNPDHIQKQISQAFNLRPAKDDEELKPGIFQWDKHCPGIIAFHSSLRPELARSQLVKEFKLVVQDRSFCLGPATFTKLVSQLNLAGNVVQTHVNSPRTTAYLANILSHNDRIKNLMAFSAGKRKTEYESYFTALGMTNVMIFADRLVDVSPDASYMEEVVAVFATPPNSYSAVTDPIDLVCSRGGDLSILEILTESEETKEGKTRVNQILEEQRKTLKFAMSRPQIQVVLYETHSELDVENDSMIARTVVEVNKVARLHHAALQGKIFEEQQQLQQQQQQQKAPPENKEINNNEEQLITSILEQISDQSLDEKLIAAEPTQEMREKFLDSIAVPNTDLFENPELPNLCPNDDVSCVNLKQAGCFLALLQRKQVIRLDNKYMIQMAENRGLFGSTQSSSSRAKGGKGRKKQQKPPTPIQKSKRRLKDTEVSRIAAPTHTFLRHTQKTTEVEKCPKCAAISDEGDHELKLYKQWWSETTRHIMGLKEALVKSKVIPTTTNKAKKQPLDSKTVVETLQQRSKVTQIDEIAARSREAKAPVYPRLRLTRESNNVNDLKYKNKVLLQIPVTNVGRSIY